MGSEMCIRDSSLSCALWKDDLLAPASTSLKVEEQRRKFGPYHLTSEVLSTGSIFTEGEHIFINNTHPDLSKAWESFFSILEYVDHEFYNSSMIVLRDFPVDNPYNALLHDQGFVKANMPDSCVFTNFNWKSPGEFPDILSRRSRRHFFKDIASFKDKFSVKINSGVEESMLYIFESLYENVRLNNPGLNTFPFPESLFEKMNENPNWEFIILTLEGEWTESKSAEVVGVMFCYKNLNITYVPEFVGMDYRYTREFNVYRQLLYQTILRAAQLNFKKIDFGLTASFEKRKLGATVIPKVCYIQAKDNFSLELLEIMQTSK